MKDNDNQNTTKPVETKDDPPQKKAKPEPDPMTFG